MKGFDKDGVEYHWYKKKGDSAKYGCKKKGEKDSF